MHYSTLCTTSPCLAPSHHCLVSASAACDWCKGEGLFPGTGSIFLSLSLLSEVWDSPCPKLNVTGLTCFVSEEFCNGRRHTGQVDCFLSHISMQERWKLWPHFGMMRSTSLSLYSAKHITHLQWFIYSSNSLIPTTWWAYLRFVYTQEGPLWPANGSLNLTVYFQ